MARPRSTLHTVAFIAAALAHPSGAWALSDALERGEDLYYGGRYSEAASLLETVARDTSRPREERVRAYEIAAFCRFLRGQNVAARETWKRLLQLDPAHELDPVEVSPELIEFFAAIPPPAGDTTKTIPKTPSATAAAEQSARAAGPRRTSPTATSVEDPRPCGILLCLTPFGVGQLANGNALKAALFGGSQMIFLGLNVGLYWSLRTGYTAGSYNQSTADRKLLLQHVFLGLFIASATTGIVDAFLFP